MLVASTFSPLPLPLSVIFLATLLIVYNQPVQSFAMTWKNTWADILNGGNPRWKVDDPAVKKIALAHIEEHSTPGGPLHILCPLAGDDPFVHHAWSRGHHVTAVDVVPAALLAMRDQFGAAEEWSSSEAERGDGVTWQHESGRATLLEGDMLAKRPALVRSFDAIYDKDSFGALDLDARPKFCERLSEFVKEGGTVYIEVKNKDSGREFGPPYHVEKKDLMAPLAFGTWCEHVVCLGEVYPLKLPGMKQCGHILRKVALKR